MATLQPIQPGTPMTVQAPTTIPSTYTAPGANLAIYNATNQPAINNILGNPYFIQALAAAGTALDPQGTGGNLGAAANKMVASRTAARANAQARADENTRHEEMMDAIRSLGGMSPRGMQGPYGLEAKEDGSFVIKMDPRSPVKPAAPPSAPAPNTQTSTPPAASNRDTRSSAPTGGVSISPPVSIEAPQQPVPRQVVPQRQSAIRPSDLLPFYRAPLV